MPDNNEPISDTERKRKMHEAQRARLDELDTWTRGLWHAVEAEAFSNYGATDRANTHAQIAQAFATLDHAIRVGG